MKTLKFTSEQIASIVSGKRYVTWRLYDDKQLDVNDEIALIDNSNGKIFGHARINEITIKRINDLNQNDQIGNEKYAGQSEILAAFKRFYGSGVSIDSVVKVIKFRFLGEKLDKLDVEKTTHFKEVKVFTDGGSRGNPGPSATGFVILDKDDTIIETGGNYIGITTNNQAEYQAVRQALQAAEKLGARVIEIYMDSLLVVNQMTGVFKIRNRDLWPINEAIKELTKRFEKVTFTHVPRELNKHADAKVNEILDGQKRGGLRSDLQ